MERLFQNRQLPLDQIREGRGLTIREIADSTKINPWYLRAIEKGEFEKLPGGVYDISYIRQYAGAIDYDAAEILAVYHSVVSPSPPPDPRPERSKKPWVRLSLWPLDALLPQRGHREAQERG